MWKSDGQSSEHLPCLSEGCRVHDSALYNGRPAAAAATGSGHMNRTVRKFVRDKFDTLNKTEVPTHVPHVNGWVPAVYMSCKSQKFRLFSRIEFIRSKFLNFFFSCIRGHSVIVARAGVPAEGSCICARIWSSNVPDIGGCRPQPPPPGRYRTYREMTSPVHSTAGTHLHACLTDWASQPCAVRLLERLVQLLE